jgi:hypothetical protein
LEQREGVHYIAPIDGKYGGSWIAVNEYGLSVCLLNGTPRAGQFTSRGFLVLSLIAVRSAMEAMERLRQLDMKAYSPFTLAVLTPQCQTAIADWDGGQLRISDHGDARMPLISSSFDVETVRQKRSSEFENMVKSRGGVDEEMLVRFHASHASGPDAYSPCMHRPDAETVSFSRVRVAGEEVEFNFSPVALCRGHEFQSVRMERR